MGFPTILVALAGLSVVGGNTEDATANATARWVAQVNARLDSAINADATVFPRHLYGVTALAFRVSEDGRARDVRVVRSSSSHWMDMRAVDQIRVVGRLPALPAGHAGRTVYALIQMGTPEGNVGTAEREAIWQHARLAVREDANGTRVAQGEAPVLLMLQG